VFHNVHMVNINNQLLIMFVQICALIVHLVVVLAPMPLIVKDAKMDSINLIINV